ncbi:MAG TPA: cupredoxin domain-containing protein [Candidatus Nanoarchaeia archaeon]|nr:cupredoxin domain-containing protein [Candidatus Nanoarchaeia archaeon]
MKTFTAFVIMAVLLILVGGFVFSKSANQNANPETNNQEGGDFQKIVLGVKNLNYYPNTITVQSGIPVRIYLDSSVSGCLRSFTIRDFGVAKYLKMPSDYLEFTPNKKGTFSFACSMGMGTGTLIVE